MSIIVAPIVTAIVAFMAMMAGYEFTNVAIAGTAIVAFGAGMSTS